MDVKRYRRAAILYTVCTFIWVFLLVMDIVHGELISWAGLIHALCTVFFAVDAVLMWRKWKTPDKK